MELGLSNPLIAGDPRLVDHIIGEVKSQGIFDQFRKECIADVDTKPAYQNLRTRVEGSVNSFLNKQVWKADLNKNQLRETLRKHINDAPYLDIGVERIVDQVVNPKIYSVFMSQVEDVVYKFLGIDRPKPKEKNGPCSLKDLLPKDLDPVSPESDKNSNKDLCLESIENSNDRDTNKEEKSVNEKTTKTISQNDQNSQNSIGGTPKDDSKNEPKINEHYHFNTSNPSEEKIDEEDEASPSFEPIDIINFHESNLSNDSHLSGISELTSHRSRSPYNELSRDDFDFNNQDSHLSKVSSDSRLSIVTDFGSSVQTSPLLDETPKESKTDDTCPTDTSKTTQNVDTSKNKNKDLIQDNNYPEGDKNLKNNNVLGNKNIGNDKLDMKKDKDKIKSSDSSKLKNVKDKTHSKDAKHKERKKSSRHHSPHEDKHSKKRLKIKEGSVNIKDTLDVGKNDPTKHKDEKTRESEKKDSNSKEIKDLKDLYKEKIRELREKKELTEKEKLKSNKDSKEKRDSSRDKKSSKNDHKNSTTKVVDKVTEFKSKNVDSKERSKREDKCSSKHGKVKNLSTKTMSVDKIDKQDSTKLIKSEKEGKNNHKKEYKTNHNEKVIKKDADKNHALNKKDNKNDHSREKKRREEKKSKSKDDHSSLRKNSNDRRSTDRDGSNGSNSRSLSSNNSNFIASSNKSGTSNLNKDTNHVNNSSSETSDGIEETSIEKFNIDLVKNDHSAIHQRQSNLETNETNLPLKKRTLFNEDLTPEIKVKKPKFAKNLHEAKKLMKIRRKMEKQKLQDKIVPKIEDKDGKKSVPEQQSNVVTNTNAINKLPDEERVQIIEIPDEEYEEPYPEEHSNLTLHERSLIMLEEESIINKMLKQKLDFNLYNSEQLLDEAMRQSMNQKILREKSLYSNNVSNDNQEKLLKNDESLFHSEPSIELPIQDQSNPIEECIPKESTEMQMTVDNQLETQSKETVEACPEQETCKINLDNNDTDKFKSSETETINTDESKTETTMKISIENHENCQYFETNDTELVKFSDFLTNLESQGCNSVEDMIEIMGGQIVSSMPMAMGAPPLPKRKLSTSPLSDIIFNNTNNNNDGHNKVVIPTINESVSGNVKKRKLIPIKKQPRSQGNLFQPQGPLNGENFVMPLSPESDVSATSEKYSSSNSIKDGTKEDKRQPRSNQQRYSSDDLYKPRPLFSSSSRRSRRTNQT